MNKIFKLATIVIIFLIGFYLLTNFKKSKPLPIQLVINHYWSSNNHHSVILLKFKQIIKKDTEDRLNPLILNDWKNKIIVTQLKHDASSPISINPSIHIMSSQSSDNLKIHSYSSNSIVIKVDKNILHENDAFYISYRDDFEYKSNVIKINPIIDPEESLRQQGYIAQYLNLDLKPIAQKWIDIHPEYYKGYYYMGLALENENNYKEALNFFNQSMELTLKSEKLDSPIMPNFGIAKKIQILQTKIKNQL